MNEALYSRPVAPLCAEASEDTFLCQAHPPHSSARVSIFDDPRCGPLAGKELIVTTGQRRYDRIGEKAGDFEPENMKTLVGYLLHLDERFR